MTDVIYGTDSWPLLPRTAVTARLAVAARGLLAVPDVRADRTLLRKACPARPGVYAMLDARGGVLYVGKSRCLRSRLASYFRADDVREKAARILGAADLVTWEVLPDELATLVREVELIHVLRPPYNVQYHPKRRRRAYLGLTAGPAPRLFVVRAVPGESPWNETVQALAGPFPAPRQVEEAALHLADLLGLRTCDDEAFARQQALGPGKGGCMRADLGLCSAPCRAPSPSADAARRARRFLAGGEPKLLSELEARMQTSALALEFERAALERDRLLSLRWLKRRIRWLSRARRKYDFVYPVTGDAGATSLYLIRHGCVVAAATLDGDDVREETARLIADVFASPHALPPATSALTLLDGDRVQVVAGWFRANTPELARVLTPEAATSLCRSS